MPDDDEGCSGAEDDGMAEGHDGVCSSMFADAEEVLPNYIENEPDEEEAVSAHEDDNAEPEQKDEAAGSDAGSEESAEVDVEADGKDGEEQDSARSAPDNEAASIPVEDVQPAAFPKKKKKKNKRKKKRKSSKQVEVAPAPPPKKPAVPRFPHPSWACMDGEFLPVAATTVPMTEKSPSVINMKDRLAPHLLLGRFPRRPLAGLIGEGLEEGAARAGDGGATGSGHDLEGSAAAESLGLMNESANSTWNRPHRSQSVDGRDSGQEASSSNFNATGGKDARSQSHGAGRRR